MIGRSIFLIAFLALSTTVFALPTPASLDARLKISLPGGPTLIDTGDDLGDLSEFSPIEDGFLEGDVDTGGGSGSTG
jgi:hypothetical protein